MGRVKKYSRQHSNNKRNKSALKQRSLKSQDDLLEKTPDTIKDHSDSEMNESNRKDPLSVAKRKQIFKKSKDGRRAVKKQILELKMASKKLRKRNLDQKSEKKDIAKQIKSLKSQLKRNRKGEADSDSEEESDGDDQWPIPWELTIKACLNSN